MLIRRLIILTFLALAGFYVQAQAANFEVFKEDLKPLSGYLIMSKGQEVLVDLGANQGVNVGDLFAVIKEGEEIIHPVSNKVMGTLNEVKAVLKVTRTENEYSFAEILREEQDLVRGDIVTRYAELKATLWDYTKNGEAFYTSLVRALPKLKWAQYEEAQSNMPAKGEAPKGHSYDLVFVLNDDALQVRDSAFKLVKNYSFNTPVDQNNVESAEQILQPPLETALVSDSKHVAPVSWERSGFSAAKGFNVNFPGFSNFGSLPDGTLMADFTEAGDRLLVATTDGSEIRVFELGTSLEEIAQGDTKLPGKILSVHWWQPDADGIVFLATTVSMELNQAGGISSPGQKASGAIFRLENNQLVSVQEQLPYMLGAFDINADGRNELLLGQEFDRDVFFGQIKELTLDNGRIKNRAPTIALPRNFPVQGSIITDLSGDGQPEAAWIYNKVLSVFSKGEIVYESSEEMGGSLAQMNYSANPGIKESSMFTSSFEVPPVAHDLDGDNVPELFALASEGDFLNAPGVGPGIKKSWLAVFKFREGMFIKGSVGDEMDQPLQGLHATDKTIYFVSTAAPNWLGKSGKSHLLAIPLTK